MSKVSARIWCWLVGHDWHVLQVFYTGGKRLQCDHCSIEVGVSNDGQMLRWDAELEKFYRSIGVKVKP